MQREPAMHGWGHGVYREANVVWLEALVHMRERACTKTGYKHYMHTGASAAWLDALPALLPKFMSF